MSSIDSFEPYWLESSLIVGVPSLLLSSIVYYRVWRNEEYKMSNYIQLFLCKALNETVAYFFNLLLLHLPIQNFLYPILKNMTHSPIIPIFGFILMVTILASFLYGISLSLNRYMAIARIAWFRKYNDGYTLKSVGLIYPLPILFGLRALFWQPYLYEIPGKDGPIFLYFTPAMDGFTEVYDGFITAYYVICCGAELAINGATLCAIMTKKVFEKSTVKRRAEFGLFVTTLCSCLLNLFFTVAQVCIQFFKLTPAAFIAMRGQVIIIDIMSLSGVYILLAFSPTLRNKIFKGSRKISILPLHHQTATSHIASEENGRSYAL